MNRPWYRSCNNTWYATLRGEQVKLGTDPRFVEKRPTRKPKQPPPEVLRHYNALAGAPAVGDCPLSFCIDKYLESLDECTSTTRKRAKHYLAMFQGEFGDRDVSAIKNHDVTDFLKDKSWKQNTKHDVIARIHACLNYCVEQDWIAANPLKGKLKFPAIERREEVMSAEDRGRAIDAAVEPFKSVLLFFEGTGVRPIELRFARVEKCDLKKGVILVQNKTRKKTGNKERAVFLSTRMIELCRSLIGDREKGWLFRNKFGDQWTQTALEHRITKLCATLDITKGVTLYSFRHGFASHLINDRRMNPAMVAIQLGHTNLQQLMRTYLHSDHEAMRKALDGE